MSTFTANLPIWYQLSHLLRLEIIAGKRRPGDRIESEVRMAKTFGVSVAPVRQALRALEQEGLIVRRRGSGTYVSDTPLARNASTTPLESLFLREFTKPAVIFALGTVETPPAFVPYFADAGSVGYVRRLAFREEMPWSYGTLYFQTAFTAELTAERFARYPLYRLLRDYCGVEAVRSHFEVKAIGASIEIATHLGIAPFSPALSILSVGFDEAGRAIGAFEMAYLGDPFVFQFETSH
jgi:GntR family transcriptional regulator